MLDKTPKELYERKALRINPAKTCQPIGAMYAALGIHKCLPHSHGSQGCCSYHRMQLTRHFKDPIMASTSSFTEGACVFGGGSNMKTAVKNIFEIYEPDIIAVHTTCLSETIGDDLKTIIAQSQSIVPEGKHVIHASTPSYVGSHVTGYSNMVKAIVTYLAENTETPNEKINIIPGFVSPGDIREIKKLLQLLGVPFIMMPDTSGVVDAGMTGHYDMYPAGGTKLEDVKDTGNSKHTLALGSFSSEAGAAELDKKCKVPMDTLTMPIGIEAVDRFLMTVCKLTDKEVPYEIEEERTQLVDLMLDAHQYLYGKKVAISGDPDTVISMTEFAVSLGMIPKYIVTGTPGASFEKQIKAILVKAGIEEECKYKAAGDLFELHQWIKNEPVDLLIGTTHSKFIARAEDIPLIRFGFPIIDRYAHAYMPTTGYKGAIRIIEMFTNAILDRQDRDCAEEDFELVM
jgi:nitrogenase molybdenum-iron protein beta chain